jgi:alkyl hydroperoxide reductase subunit AhpF
MGNKTKTNNKKKKEKKLDVLILGSGEAGKSTFFYQTKKLYKNNVRYIGNENNNDKNDDEKLLSQNVLRNIYLNLYGKNN